MLRSSRHADAEYTTGTYIEIQYMPEPHGSIVLSQHRVAVGVRGL